MKHVLCQLTLVVNDYDEALDFYIKKLNFELIEDTALPEAGKRWVVIAPPGANGEGATLLLAKASKAEQLQAIGNQSGGRVFLFLNTDDIHRDYQTLLAKGITFVREPTKLEFGTAAVFKDCYGNLWDLVERA